jgi:hypothetical protein
MERLVSHWFCRSIRSSPANYCRDDKSPQVEDFEKMVNKVTGIEKKLGIYDLAQFAPNV